MVTLTFVVVDDQLTGPVIPVQAGITVEVMLDAPCPRVGITVTGLSPTAESTITLWRTTAGEGRSPVRGLRRAVVVDATYVQDFEVPLGRPVTYMLEVAGPVTPPITTATVTVPSDRVWLQDPLDPSTACEVATRRTAGALYMTSSALAEIRYEAPGAAVSVMGARFPTLLGGGRRAATSVPFEVLTTAIEASNRLRVLLDAASPLLMRTIPLISPPLPALAYLRADAVEQPRAGYRGGTLTRWSLSGDLVQGPSINLLVPTWTYAQVSALWETYAAAAAGGRTYLDWMKDPTP